MVLSSLEANITWINALQKKNGISKTVILSEIVLGTTKMDVTQDILQPRSYVHCNIKIKVKKA